jgi:hypothetical protein
MIKSALRIALTNWLTHKLYAGIHALALALVIFSDNCP